MTTHLIKIFTHISYDTKYLTHILWSWETQAMWQAMALNESTKCKSSAQYSSVQNNMHSSIRWPRRLSMHSWLRWMSGESMQHAIYTRYYKYTMQCHLPSHASLKLQHLVGLVEPRPLSIMHTACAGQLPRV